MTSTEIISVIEQQINNLQLLKHRIIQEVACRYKKLEMSGATKSEAKQICDYIESKRAPGTVIKCFINITYFLKKCSNVLVIFIIFIILADTKEKKLRFLVTG